jgi:hypothetical protein
MAQPKPGALREARRERRAWRHALRAAPRWAVAAFADPARVRAAIEARNAPSGPERAFPQADTCGLWDLGRAVPDFAACAEATA